jgi:hypothetical protein
MKKTLLILLALSAFSASARADVLSISFDQSSQIGSPGETLQFFGTITNESDQTVYLNSDAPNLSGLSLTVNDLFFSNVPISLAPNGAAGDSSGDIELFDVLVSNPLLDAQGTYPGIYTLYGGADGNASNYLGQATFSVTTVPEPSALSLLLVAMALILIFNKEARGSVGPFPGMTRQRSPRIS